ncbi:MAG: YicC family protein [Bryobacter sp.]|jgi:uncharacterized protein (TIGR00255 family)|nr:YicC family protein [Bryobacter sp. CoA8 C33]
MSIRSMTGYARLRCSLPEGELTLAVKSVNHRALDLHFHMSSFFDPLEAPMRNLIRQHLHRGHIDIRCSLSREAAQQGLQVNPALLDAYQQLFTQHPGLGHPNLNEALRLPGMLVETREDEISDTLQDAILSTLAAVLADLNLQREREGSSLAAQMLDYNSNIHELARQVRGFREGMLPLLRQRIETRIAELLNGQPIDAARLAQEAAFLADRGDVEEEVTRLLTHSAQLESLLKQGGETGKKLDFLLQEMNREANTILSKSNNAGDYGLRVTDIGLAIKTGIERIREQSLNLE